MSTDQNNEAASHGSDRERGRGRGREADSASKTRRIRALTDGLLAGIGGRLLWEGMKWAGEQLLADRPMPAADGLLEPADSPAPAPSDIQRIGAGRQPVTPTETRRFATSYDLVNPGFFGILAWTSRIAVNIRLRSWPPQSSHRVVPHASAPAATSIISVM